MIIALGNQVGSNITNTSTKGVYVANKNSVLGTFPVNHTIDVWKNNVSLGRSTGITLAGISSNEIRVLCSSTNCTTVGFDFFELGDSLTSTQPGKIYNAMTWYLNAIKTNPWDSTVFLFGDQTVPAPALYNRAYITDCANAVLNREPQYILAVGDYYDIGLDDTFDTLLVQFETDYIGTMKWIPVMGNHDYDVDDTGEAWADYMGNSVHDSINYSRSLYGDLIEFFIFDPTHKDEGGWLSEAEATNASRTYYMGTDACQWLFDALDASTATWKVVCFHKPSRGSSGGSYAPAMELNWDSLGVDLVINGHKHVFERINYGDVEHLTVISSGCFSQGNFGTPVSGSLQRMNTDTDPDFAKGGFATIKVTTDKLTIRWHAVTLAGSVVLDKYSYEIEKP